MQFTVTIPNPVTKVNEVRLSRAQKLVDKANRKERVSKSKDPGVRLVKDMAEHLTSDGTEYEVS